MDSVPPGIPSALPNLENMGMLLPSNELQINFDRMQKGNSAGMMLFMQRDIPDFAPAIAVLLSNIRTRKHIAAVRTFRSFCLFISFTS